MVTNKVPPHLALSYQQVSDMFHPSLAATVLGLMTVVYGMASHRPSANSPELILKGCHQKSFLCPTLE